MKKTKNIEIETLAVDKIVKENLELREAIKRYTVELEEKNRELEIEASLERVRAVAMSMHKTDDLLSICKVSFKEFKKLGFNNIRNAIIHIPNDKQNYFMDYDYSDLTDGAITKIKYGSHPIVDEYLKKIKSAQDDYFEVIINEEQLDSWRDFREKSGQKDDPRLNKATALYYYFFSIGIGDIGISTFKPIDESQIIILKRFRNVFDLAYRRYIDIAQAAAQAREAQIEASLEKVRTVALSLIKSDEMLDIAEVLFNQLLELGFTNIRNAIIDIHNNNNETFLDYDYSHEMGKTVTLMSYYDHPIIEKQVRQIESSNDAFFEIILEGQDLQDLIEMRLKNGEQEDPRLRRIEQLTYNLYSFGNGAIGISNFGLLSDDHKLLLKRFRNVFAFAYKRYSDLVQAEIQAREAKIEAALERVRAKAMAMHSPEDLSATVNIFFKELKELGINPVRCGVGQIDEATRTTSLTTTTSSQQGDSFEVIGKIKQTGHPVLDGIFDHWRLQKEYHPVLKGNDIKAYYDVMNPQIRFPEYPTGVTQYGNCFYFKEGFVFAWTKTKLSEEELQIFRRFTSVIGLTYRRYLELKEAEFRAIESVKQASLDRIRAEIASMRTTEDLNSITPIIWNELKTLEVPFIRCGVFIVDENQEKVQVYLTTPDGKSLAVLNLPFDSNTLTKNAVDFWRQQKVYQEHWNREEFINWVKSMMELGQVQKAETYQGSSIPPESLHLYFVPFTQGMLYVGDISPLIDEKLDLVKTLAEAFSIAYARYEDFKNLEDAKNKIEITLSELKSAQAQLIHSEKMASLGELTAGIAHEIKNPLNFVNNFSEVSNDLFNELEVELKNNNMEEVSEIVNELKQNLERINLHGKRADSIVKGMLLHSRGTSGEKTLTDINDLLDQYVNLAYHGIRAQDKDFNITIEKKYDDTLEKINVVPQDISRVFLNIVNNACYAANEKKKNNGADFNPVLSVSTLNDKDYIEIKIRDNGNGIPESIRRNLFNPFFTTKPTGEGTGLGLSLSYDIIVKQHAGEIKFESEEGKFTEFIIIIPKSS